MRNRQLTELLRDVELPVGPHDLRLGHWDREAVHQLFDTLQFRVLRERLYATLSAVEPEADQGFDVDVRVARRRRGRRSGWPSTPRPASVPGSRFAAPGAAAPARCPGSRSPPPTAPPPGSTRPSSPPRTRRRWPPGSPIPISPRRCTTSRARCSRCRPRADARRRHQRHRARGLPRAARAAFVRPGRPRAALPAPRAAGRVGRRRRRDGQLTLRRHRRGRDEAGRGRAARPGRARPRRSRSSRTSSAAAAPGCCARSSCRWSACCRDMERVGIAADTEHLRAALVRRYGAEVRPLRAGRLRRGRPRVQPRLAQAAAGGAVRRAGAAEDQADQDRLHHRCRRAGLAGDAERPPGDPGAAAPPRRRPAEDGRRFADPDGRRRPAASTPRSTR